MNSAKASSVRPRQHCRFEELLIYIAVKSEDDPHFGPLKMNKILFYADHAAYQRFGQAITGCAYQKLENGPAPRAYVPASRLLVKNGAAKMVAGSGGVNQPRERFVALRGPDLRAFEPREIQIVDEMIHTFRQDTGWGVSQISHNNAGWLAADWHEDIPYETAFISQGRLKASHCEHALSLSPSAPSAVS